MRRSDNIQTSRSQEGERTQALEEPRAAIDAHLAALIDALDTPRNLSDALRYAVLAGGKRLRPILAWHACAAAAGSASAAPASLPAGAAVELVHAFSLVHDDLPAMDDDDLRRGRPTLHRHTSEALAILAGDAMLTMAFGALGTPAAGSEPFTVNVRARLTDELIRGTNGMISGQVLDTLGGFEPGTGDAARVELIHRQKTGALLRAACRMGATIGVGDADEASREERLGAITRYADAIGLMFQIIDDLLDVEQSPEHTGKRTRKDAEAGKLTYPVVHGIDVSRQHVEKLLGQAVTAIEPLGPAGVPLSELVGYLARRTR